MSESDMGLIQARDDKPWGPPLVEVQRVEIERLKGVLAEIGKLADRDVHFLGKELIDDYLDAILAKCQREGVC